MANVKVAVRVRPPSKKELDAGAISIVDINEDVLSITNLKITSSEGDRHRERVKNYSFDHCYNSVDRQSESYASQELIYQDLGTEVLNASFGGYNACLFAYGQTGSGKTYTVMGDDVDAGLIPRICEGMCSRVDDLEQGITFKIEVSYLEIYNERVRDLLSSSNDANYTLKVREHPKDGPYVQDLTRHLVSDFNSVMMLIMQGNRNRTTAATHMHEASSRSHAIFTLTFIQAKMQNNMPSEIVSKINLVDLAGSERANLNYSKGRLQEGANINKSLVTLGNCISALGMDSEDDDAENSMALSAASMESLALSEDTDITSPKRRPGFIPYRNSVLTWLLKDSLGGNSRTIMIATISPSSIYFNETMSTLRYARRAKRIVNQPLINEDPNVRLIRELRAEINRLKTLLSSASLSSSQASLVQDVTLTKMLVENEQKVDQLTEAWVDKWREAARIMQECNVGIRRESMGVIVESELPHLIGMDDDLLSTGIILYHLMEGETTIGREDSETEQDIVLWGPGIDCQHAVIINHRGKVTLRPIGQSACAVNGNDIREPTPLSQGAVVLLGKTNMFRFNNPAEAARLREKRASSIKPSDVEEIRRHRKNSVTLRVHNNVSAITEEGTRLRKISLTRENPPVIRTSPSMPGSRSQESCSPVSEVSSIMMYNPGVELERQHKIKVDKVESTKKRLEELQDKKRLTEAAHQKEEERMKMAYQEHQGMIQEQKDLLQRLRDEHEMLKEETEKELQEMTERLAKEKEQGLRQLEEECQSVKRDQTRKASVPASEGAAVPQVVAKDTEQLSDLSVLDVDRKRLTQMELMHRQSQRKAEAVLERRQAAFDRQRSASMRLIEQEERRLHEIECIPSLSDRLASASNDSLDSPVRSEDESSNGIGCWNGKDDETRAVIGWGRVSPIGGRSDTDSASSKAASNSSDKDERTDPKPVPIINPPTSVSTTNSNESLPHRTTKTSLSKSQHPSSSSKKPQAAATPVQPKPTSNSVFSRLYKQQAPKFKYLRRKPQDSVVEERNPGSRTDSAPPKSEKRRRSHTDGAVDIIARSDRLNGKLNRHSKPKVGESTTPATLSPLRDSQKPKLRTKSLSPRRLPEKGLKDRDLATPSAKRKGESKTKDSTLLPTSRNRSRSPLTSQPAQRAGHISPSKSPKVSAKPDTKLKAAGEQKSPARPRRTKTPSSESAIEKSKKCKPDNKSKLTNTKDQKPTAAAKPKPSPKTEEKGKGNLSRIIKPIAKAIEMIKPKRTANSEAFFVTLSESNEAVPENGEKIPDSRPLEVTLDVLQEDQGISLERQPAIGCSESMEDIDTVPSLSVPNTNGSLESEPYDCFSKEVEDILSDSNSYADSLEDSGEPPPIQEYRPDSLEDEGRPLHDDASSPQNGELPGGSPKSRVSLNEETQPEDDRMPLKDATSENSPELCTEDSRTADAQNSDNQALSGHHSDYANEGIPEIDDSLKELKCKDKPHHPSEPNPKDIQSRALDDTCSDLVGIPQDEKSSVQDLKSRLDKDTGSNDKRPSVEISVADSGVSTDNNSVTSECAVNDAVNAANNASTSDIECDVDNLLPQEDDTKCLGQNLADIQHFTIENNPETPLTNPICGESDDVMDQHLTEDKDSSPAADVENLKDPHKMQPEEYANVSAFTEVGAVANHDIPGSPKQGRAVEPVTAPRPDVVLDDMTAACEDAHISPSAAKPAYETLSSECTSDQNLRECAEDELRKPVLADPEARLQVDLDEVFTPAVVAIGQTNSHSSPAPEQTTEEDDRVPASVPAAVSQRSSWKSITPKKQVGKKCKKRRTVRKPKSDKKQPSQERKRDGSSEGASSLEFCPLGGYQNDEEKSRSQSSPFSSCSSSSFASDYSRSDSLHSRSPDDEVALISDGVTDPPDLSDKPATPTDLIIKPLPSPKTQVESVFWASSSSSGNSSDEVLLDGGEGVLEPLEILEMELGQSSDLSVFDDYETAGDRTAESGDLTIVADEPMNDTFGNVDHCSPDMHSENVIEILASASKFPSESEKPLTSPDSANPIGSVSQNHVRPYQEKDESPLVYESPPLAGDQSENMTLPQTTMSEEPNKASPAIAFSEALSDQRNEGQVESAVHNFSCPTKSSSSFHSVQHPDSGVSETAVCKTPESALKRGMIEKLPESVSALPKVEDEEDSVLVKAQIKQGDDSKLRQPTAIAVQSSAGAGCVAAIQKSIAIELREDMVPDGAIVEAKADELESVILKHGKLVTEMNPSSVQEELIRLRSLLSSVVTDPCAPEMKQSHKIPQLEENLNSLKSEEIPEDEDQEGSLSSEDSACEELSLIEQLKALSEKLELSLVGQDAPEIIERARSLSNHLESAHSSVYSPSLVEDLRELSKRLDTSKYLTNDDWTADQEESEKSAMFHSAQDLTLYQTAFEISQENIQPTPVSNLSLSNVPLQSTPVASDSDPPQRAGISVGSSILSPLQFQNSPDQSEHTDESLPVFSEDSDHSQENDHLHSDLSDENDSPVFDDCAIYTAERVLSEMSSFSLQLDMLSGSDSVDDDEDGDDSSDDSYEELSNVPQGAGATNNPKTPTRKTRFSLNSRSSLECMLPTISEECLSTSSSDDDEPVPSPPLDTLDQEILTMKNQAGDDEDGVDSATVSVQPELPVLTECKDGTALIQDIADQNQPESPSKLLHGTVNSSVDEGLNEAEPLATSEDQFAQINIWEPEPSIVAERLQPFLGKEFSATKAKLNMLVRVLGGNWESFGETSSEGSRSSSPGNTPRGNVQSSDIETNRDSPQRLCSNCKEGIPLSDSETMAAAPELQERFEHDNEINNEDSLREVSREESLLPHLTLIPTEPLLTRTGVILPEALDRHFATTQVGLDEIPNSTVAGGNKIDNQDLRESCNKEDLDSKANLASTEEVSSFHDLPKKENVSDKPSTSHPSLHANPNPNESISTSNPTPSNQERPLLKHKSNTKYISGDLDLLPVHEVMARSAVMPTEKIIKWSTLELENESQSVDDLHEDGNEIPGNVSRQDERPEHRKSPNLHSPSPVKEMPSEVTNKFEVDVASSKSMIPEICLLGPIEELLTKEALSLDEKPITWPLVEEDHQASNTECSCEPSDTNSLFQPIREERNSAQSAESNQNPLTDNLLTPDDSNKAPEQMRQLQIPVEHNGGDTNLDDLQQLSTAMGLSPQRSYSTDEELIQIFSKGVAHFRSRKQDIVKPRLVAVATNTSPTKMPSDHLADRVDVAVMTDKESNQSHVYTSMSPEQELCLNDTAEVIPERVNPASQLTAAQLVSRIVDYKPQEPTSDQVATPYIKNPVTRQDTDQFSLLDKVDLQKVNEPATNEITNSQFAKGDEIPLLPASIAAHSKVLSDSEICNPLLTDKSSNPKEAQVFNDRSTSPTRPDNPNPLMAEKSPNQKEAQTSDDRSSNSMRSPFTSASMTSPTPPTPLQPEGSALGLPRSDKSRTLDDEEQMLLNELRKRTQASRQAANRAMACALRLRHKNLREDPLLENEEIEKPLEWHRPGSESENNSSSQEIVAKSFESESSPNQEVRSNEIVEEEQVAVPEIFHLVTEVVNRESVCRDRPQEEFTCRISTLMQGSENEEMLPSSNSTSYASITLEQPHSLSNIESIAESSDDTSSLTVPLDRKDKHTADDKFKDCEQQNNLSKYQQENDQDLRSMQGNTSFQLDPLVLPVTENIQREADCKSNSGALASRLAQLYTLDEVTQPVLSRPELDEDESHKDPEQFDDGPSAEHTFTDPPSVVKDSGDATLDFNPSWLFDKKLVQKLSVDTVLPVELVTLEKAKCGKTPEDINEMLQKMDDLTEDGHNRNPVEIEDDSNDQLVVSLDKKSEDASDLLEKAKQDASLKRRRRPLLSTFSDISFDLDNEDDEDLKALKETNENIDRVIAETSSLESDFEDSTDSTESELVGLLDDETDTFVPLGSSAEGMKSSERTGLGEPPQKAASAPADFMSRKNYALLKSEDPEDDEEEDYSSLHLRGILISPDKLEWLLAESESEGSSIKSSSKEKDDSPSSPRASSNPIDVSLSLTSYDEPNQPKNNSSEEDFGSNLALAQPMNDLDYETKASLNKNYPGGEDENHKGNISRPDQPQKDFLNQYNPSEMFDSEAPVTKQGKYLPEESLKFAFTKDDPLPASHTWPLKKSEKLPFEMDQLQELEERHQPKNIGSWADPGDIQVYPLINHLLDDKDTATPEGGIICEKQEAPDISNGLSQSSGVFSASTRDTDLSWPRERRSSSEQYGSAGSETEEADLRRIHQEYRDILEESQKSLEAQSHASTQATPTNAFTQTDEESPSSYSTEHDESSETSPESLLGAKLLGSSWPQRESLPGVSTKLDPRRDIAVELMEASLMHGIGETDAFLKFLDSDLPLEKWKSPETLRNRRSRLSGAPSVSGVKSPRHESSPSKHKPRQVTSITPQPPNTFSDEDVQRTSPPKMPNDSPTSPNLSPNALPSERRRFLQQLRSNIISVTSTMRPERAKIDALLQESWAQKEPPAQAPGSDKPHYSDPSSDDIDALLEESRHMREKSRAEIEKAEQNLKYQRQDRDRRMFPQRLSSTKEGPAGQPPTRYSRDGSRSLATRPKSVGSLLADGVGVRTQGGLKSDAGGHQDGSDLRTMPRRPHSADESLDMFNCKDAIDREIQCLRAASAAMSSLQPSPDSEVPSWRARPLTQPSPPPPQRYFPTRDRGVANHYTPRDQSFDESTARHSQGATPSYSRPQYFPVIPIIALHPPTPEEIDPSTIPIIAHANKVLEASYRTSSRPSSGSQEGMLPSASRTPRMSNSPAETTISGRPFSQDASSAPQAYPSDLPMPYPARSQRAGSCDDPRSPSSLNSIGRPSSQRRDRISASSTSKGSAYSPPQRGRADSPDVPRSSPARRSGRHSRRNSQEKGTQELSPIVETPLVSWDTLYQLAIDQALAYLIAETTLTGSVNPQAKNRLSEINGWRYIGKDNNILLLQKTNKYCTTDSFLGITVLRAPACTVFNLINNSTRYNCLHKSIREVKVLHRIDNAQKVIHVICDMDQCSLHKPRDFCLVIKHIQQNGRWYIVATSVRHPLCPTVSSPIRGQIYCCGMSLETVSTDNGEHCRISYLSQIDLHGDLEPTLVNRLTGRLPLCLAHLRDCIEIGQL